MPIGFLLGLLSFSLYAVGDAMTKSFSGQVGVFELQFFINLFASLRSDLPRNRAKPGAAPSRSPIRC